MSIYTSNLVEFPWPLWISAHYRAMVIPYHVIEGGYSLSASIRIHIWRKAIPSCEPSTCWL